MYIECGIINYQLVFFRWRRDMKMGCTSNWVFIDGFESTYDISGMHIEETHTVRGLKFI